MLFSFHFLVGRVGAQEIKVNEIRLLDDGTLVWSSGEMVSKNGIAVKFEPPTGASPALPQDIFARQELVATVTMAGFSPVDLHDVEGNKIGPLALFWKAGKFRRGHTTIAEILFRAPKGTRFKILQAEDLQLNIEKLEGSH